MQRRPYILLRLGIYIYLITDWNLVESVAQHQWLHKSCVLVAFVKHDRRDRTTVPKYAITVTKGAEEAPYHTTD